MGGMLTSVRECRRAEIDALHATYGACTPDSGFDGVENADAGR
jgi:hypothetical protein